MGEHTGAMVSADMARRAGANERQIGGAHYQGEYQYWDYVYDVHLNYHAGNAGKYVIRSRKKSGMQDLEKGLHYVDKCEELGIGRADTDLPTAMEATERFAASAQLTPLERAALACIVMGNWAGARDIIRDMLKA